MSVQYSFSSHKHSLGLKILYRYTKGNNIIIYNLFENNIRNSYGYFQGDKTRCKWNEKWAPLELLTLNYRYENENADVRVLVTIKLAFTPNFMLLFLITFLRFCVSYI
jgi:hypothetical protein